MRYLVTGHTGFKGAWLTLWLAMHGHKVSGLALDPLPGSLFEAAKVADCLSDDVREDIRRQDAVSAAVREIQPEVLVHLAAQPLVRESYRDPRTTITTNVMGTLNVLDAMRQSEALQAVLIITTDKVYRNVDQIHGYRESDPLGGHDPYSSSKAMADILTASWDASFSGPPLAIARAGNVIGGGDVSPDRLMPDLIMSHALGRTPVLRYPRAVRPWQHVLDCLSGYMAVVEGLLMGAGLGAWNIGPDFDSFRTVGELNEQVARLYGREGSFDLAENQPDEAGLLSLDSTRAKAELGWRNRLGFETAVSWTVDWHMRVSGGEDPRDVTEAQVRSY